MKTHTLKEKSTIPKNIGLGLAGLTLVATFIGAQVATALDLLVDTFPDAGSINMGSTPGLDWVNYRGYTVTTTWDPNQQSPDNPNPGAMYVTVDWPGPSAPNYTTSWTDMQFAFSTSGAFSPSNYIAFECDIKVDTTNSYKALDGSYGAIELIVNNSWQNVVGWAQLAATNAWQHFTGYFSAIPATNTHSEAIIGLISQTTGTLTNNVSYWIDNIRFTAVPTANTNRPALSINRAAPAGLTCICSQGGGTYQRQMIRTANSNYSWNTAAGASNTTTYAMTIASYPGPTYTGFQDQMFLIPQAGMAGNPQDANIDWDSGDVVDLEVGINADGTATGTFQYKVNQPSSWNASLIVTKSCVTGPLGTWTLTFNNNTNATVTAPDHTSTNFTISASDAAVFQNPLFVYLGDQPNVNANIGQSSTFSHFTVTGASNSISDNFISNGSPGQPYALNTNIWANDTAADSLGIFITAPDAKYWATWPTPDSGFTNVYATDRLANKLGNSQWKSLPSALTGWVLVGGNRRLAVINQSTLTAAFGYQPTNSFFALFHQ